METGVAAPLLDLFRKGAVDRDMRLLAAQGGLGLRRSEQIGVCELLLKDEDAEIARAAQALLDLLRSQPADAAAEPAPSASGEEEEDTVTALQRIAAMTPGQRLALAMKGTREERAILVRDPNRIVAVAVLSSPKITQAEVESIAKMANVSEEILRIIGNSRAWLKNYAIVAALAKNSKTPVGVSLNLLNRLLEKDVKALSTDRNVPEPLRIAARRKLVPS
jgi:hypothetical protein